MFKKGNTASSLGGKARWEGIPPSKRKKEMTQKAIDGWKKRRRLQG